MFLYIHGFLSSSQSAKALQFKRFLSERNRLDEWVCPDLPPNAEKSMQILTDIVESSAQPLTLIGSSLGGFYATSLSEKYQLKAALINPAVHPGLLLREKIGHHKAWHFDETLSFIQDDVDALNAIDVQSIQTPDNFLLFVEKGDETINYRQAISFYEGCSQVVLNGGDHTFSRFEQILPLIDGF